MRITLGTLVLLLIVAGSTLGAPLGQNSSSFTPTLHGTLVANVPLPVPIPPPDLA